MKYSEDMYWEACRACCVYVNLFDGGGQAYVGDFEGLPTVVEVDNNMRSQGIASIYKYASWSLAFKSHCGQWLSDVLFDETDLEKFADATGINEIGKQLIWEYVSKG